MFAAYVVDDADVVAALVDVDAVLGADADLMKGLNRRTCPPGNI